MSAIQPSPSKANSGVPGEWVSWEGGECPLDWRTIVMVRFRHRDTLARKSKRADRYKWHHTGSGGDIIAYRIDVPALPHEGE